MIEKKKYVVLPVHVAASIRAALLGGGSICDTENFGRANADAVAARNWPQPSSDRPRGRETEHTPTTPSDEKK